MTLLPPNATILLEIFEELAAYAFSFETDVSRLWNLGGEENPSNNLPTVPDEFLPHIAWTLGVELWPDNELVAVDEKRRLIRRYLEVRKLRGTPFGLDSVYEAIGVRGDVIERAGGDSRKIKVTFFSREKVITPALYDAITRLTRKLVPRRIDIDYTIATTFSARLHAPGRFTATPIARFVGGD